MEGYEDDHDLHFCNKCHRTIDGLENYVRHRQSGCRTTEEVKRQVYHCSSSTPDVSYPEILNADAFFSSLELQSSSKSHPRRATDLLDVRPRRSGKNEERKRKQSKDKSPDDKDEAKEKLSNLLPVVTDFDDLGIPSLVGFPEIVATSAPTSTTKPITSIVISPNKQISPSCSNIIKQESVSEQKSQEDNQRSDHEQREQQDSDWLEDTILTDLVANESENKEHLEETHLDRYADYDYQQDEELDDVILDVDIGEEDSYSESEDPDAQDSQYPPQSHTGGKWKPGGITHEDVQMNEDDGVLEENEYHQEHPPPSHTGGKWKPAESSIQCVEYESKEISGQPPPNHTRGKWVPGARLDTGTGYWCTPCGRKLASQLVYNRHLLSDLHAKRSIQEMDGVIQISKEDPLAVPKRPKLSLRQKALALKRSSEPYKPAVLDEPYTQRKRLRRRQKEILSCEMCQARVRRAQMGKHLLSHYHCRVAGVKPSGPQARRFLLENMANIVRQCPFQCASCRFYCNTEDTFLRHWRSDAHKDTISKIEGSFICALCDFWCDDNEAMDEHIMKQGHRDVVSMINGSVPIVIRRQRVLTCSTCYRRFRYNVQLGFHAKGTGHAVGFTASDEYQSRLPCEVCGHVLRSMISLQRHQLTCHNPHANKRTSAATSSGRVAPYFCSFCELRFNTAREAILHRRTSSHKETARSRKAGCAAATFTGRVCDHCAERLSSLAELKRHLLDRHPEMCHRCAKCGRQFAFSQDVTRHTRWNLCTAEKSPLDHERSDPWRCPDCSYATESEAEFLFHKALHGGTADSLGSPGESQSASWMSKYNCPLCEKVFAKLTLRDHLRQHTGERPFACGKCAASFARRSRMRAHQQVCAGPSSSGIWRTVRPSRERKFICAECNGAFGTKVMRAAEWRNCRRMPHRQKAYQGGDNKWCFFIAKEDIDVHLHQFSLHSDDKLFDNRRSWFKRDYDSEEFTAAGEEEEPGQNFIKDDSARRMFIKEAILSSDPF